MTSPDARWQPLPRGGFSGIDWSAPGALAAAWPGGVDPYLVWAEATMFAHCEGGKPDWLHLLIELAPGASARQLQRAAGASLVVKPAYLSWPQERLGFAPGFCTAHASQAFFARLRSEPALAALITRMEAALAVTSQPNSAGALLGDRLPAGALLLAHAGRLAMADAGGDADTATTDAGGAGDDIDAEPEVPIPSTPTVDGLVMAVVDDAFAVAHEHLRDATGRTRVDQCWIQDGAPQAGDGASPLGYGRMLTAAQIDAAMAEHRRGHKGRWIDEAGVYRTLGLRELTGVCERASHGTHVSDLACGNRVADAAAQARMIAVQLPRGVVDDASGGALHPHILDAVVHVLLACTTRAQVVVNISFGELGGAHDGSSILDAALAALIDGTRSRLRVVMAAGNSYQARAHGHGRLRDGQTQCLGWRLPPDDPTPTFLEWWIPLAAATRGQLSAQLTLPDGSALPALSPGEGGVWRDAQGRVQAVAVFAPRTCMARHATCLLLALAPTAATSAQAGVLLPGRAMLSLRSTDRGHSAIWDAYVEREAWRSGRLGHARSAVPSYLEDDASLPFSQQYDNDATTDDPLRASLVKREGSFNGLATSPSVVSAGGKRADNGSPADYSPRITTHTLAQRDGVRTAAVHDMDSDESAAVPGRLAAGTHSGSVVRLVGTSSAAPLLSRKLLVERARQGLAKDPRRPSR
ncbi:MAG: hypothetical protein EBS99_11295 [Betaproteobacteria bacterium]|nr:hypothetical protein [Betaproteobacteria bacterium]